MNDLTAAVIDGWDARPFSGGFEELRALCASSFTGVVRLDGTTEGGRSFDGSAGSNGDPGDPGATTHEAEVDRADPDAAESGVTEPAGAGNGDGIESGGRDRTDEPGPTTNARRPWLAMVDGAIRAVFDGEIDDFDDATGTVYTTPAGAPVLLRAMIERAGGERGALHTERRSAVESALPDDFSGYVELIGNGLDGAHYVVYDEGRVSPVVLHEGGDEPAVRTDPDAFDRASEHTSVYEVRAVSLDSVSVPEPDPEPESPTQPDSTTQPDSITEPTADNHPGPADRPIDTGAGILTEPGTVAIDPAARSSERSASRPGTDRTADDTDGALLTELRAERDRLRADVDRLETALDAYRSGTSRGAGVDADGGVDTDERDLAAPHGDWDPDDGGVGLREPGPRAERASDGPGTDAAVTGDSVARTERSSEEALAGTTLLVRYGSQGAPTLARVGAGTDPDAVRANLRIAPHTDFDAADTVVSGTDFDAFLESTIEYRFVEWVLGDLFFEIRDTGNEQSLGALSEAIPAIDRADLRGTVDVEYVSEGETERGTEGFDVVFRDRMNEPLLVARLDETSAPAPVERVTGLLTAANRVGETVENLAGAICVSGGYFEPEALRTADEVTDGGFLSRDARKSFVKRSRRRGYHLCLVEAMGETFHLSVPDL